MLSWHRGKDMLIYLMEQSMKSKPQGTYRDAQQQSCRPPLAQYLSPTSNFSCFHSLSHPPCSTSTVAAAQLDLHESIMQPITATTSFTANFQFLLCYPAQPHHTKDIITSRSPFFPGFCTVHWIISTCGSRRHLTNLNVLPQTVLIYPFKQLIWSQYGWITVS